MVFVPNQANRFGGQQNLTTRARTNNHTTELRTWIRKPSPKNMPNLYFYIPTDEIAKVIGAKGKNIKQLDREHKVTSRIFKERDPFPGYKLKSDAPPSLWTAMMVSSPVNSNVFSACRSVASRVEEVGDFILEYSMSKERHQLFFQNGSLPIKQISATSDCRVNVPVQDGPVQLECNNLEDLQIALNLVLAHAGLEKAENKRESSQVAGRTKGVNRDLRGMGGGGASQQQQRKPRRRRKNPQSNQKTTNKQDKKGDENEKVKEKKTGRNENRRNRSKKQTKPKTNQKN